MAGQPGNAGNNANYALPPEHLEHPLYSAYSHPAYAQHALRPQQQQRRAQSASSQLAGGLSYEALFAQRGLAGGQSAVDAVQGALASVSVVSQGLPVVSASPVAPQLGLPQLAAPQAAPPFYPPQTAPEQSQAPVMVPVAVEAAVGQPHPAPLPPQPAVLPPPPPPAQPPAPSSSSLVPPSSVPPVTRPLSGPGSRQHWTASEDAELIRLVKLLPPVTWAEIGETLGRKGGGCGMRWYKVLRERLTKEVAAQQAAATEENGTDLSAGSSRVDYSHTSLCSSCLFCPFHLLSFRPFCSSPLSSPDMTVGSSSSANVFTASHAVSTGENATSAAAPRARKVIANARTGIPVKLPTVPAAFVPSTSLTPPFTSALDPSLASLAEPSTSASASPSLGLPAPPEEKHINTGPHFLPPSALIPNPPIPLHPNTVLRERRTRAISDLEKEQNEVREKREEEKRRRLEEQAKGKESEVDEDAEGGETEGVAAEGEKKKVKKRGTAMHACPAKGCTAAFKRSEHLRRHYKSVHRGEKPWPCTIVGCGKSFSRKDNLQQYQALVHLVRATCTYPSGKSTADPPSPSSAEGVITTFEKVEVTRTAASAADEKKKTSRAKSKAIPPAVQPELVEVQAKPRGVDEQPEFDFQGALQMLAAATGSPGGDEEGRRSSASSSATRSSRPYTVADDALILRLLAQGVKQSEIAEKVGRTTGSIGGHLFKMRKKRKAKRQKEDVSKEDSEMSDGDPEEVEVEEARADQQDDGEQSDEEPDRPKPSRKPFTPSDDANIVRLRDLNWSWQQIGEEIGRGKGSCSSRYARLVEKRRVKEISRELEDEGEEGGKAGEGRD
ncbi:hypothetical protein JCM8547_001089 [Rhodosporidiobolus lusitaniae]